MFQKGTKAYSVLRLKCPKCQEGNLFLTKNPYDLKKFIAMPDVCPVCKQDFKIEPGFYSGALWVSYPIIVLLLIPFAFGLMYYTNLALGWIFLFISFYTFGLQPLLMRWSRAIWINVFVQYDSTILKK
jgi:uncharacterized protein (DUF983 family)